MKDFFEKMRGMREENAVVRTFLALDTYFISPSRRKKARALFLILIFRV